MKKSLFFLLALSLTGMLSAAEAASVPTESEAIMLQGFHWDSYNTNSSASQSFGRTKWIDLLKDTTELREQFDIIWLPPSAAGGGVGYYPKQWSIQDSDWGSKSKLKELIAALHRGGTQVLADVVVNHHATTSGWGGFAKETFGSYGTYQLTQADICSGDEAFTTSGSDIKGSSTHGAADTGDNDGGCRDLDHTSTNVQSCVKAYVQWLRSEMGYDGFRYDMVKGYHGRYVAMYNRASEPTFSVGECFDGSLTTLKNYIAAAEQTTLVFDFAAKFNVFNNAIATSSYGNLKDGKANKLHREPGYGRYSVTFIDNHDTFNRGEGNEFKDNTSKGASISNSSNHAKVLEANAYLLSMPGVPCVFYPHWSALKEDIMPMIRARRLAGVHSESAIVSEETGGPYKYQAVVQGHRGKLMLRIGSSRATELPEGYTQIAHGANYNIYVETSAAQGLSSHVYHPSITRVIEDGQLILVVDGVRYDVLGHKL